MNARQVSYAPNSFAYFSHPATLLILFLVGCGPTRTSGTGGMAAKELAVLSIPPLPDDAHVQIDAIQFDDAGDTYEIGKGRDFFLKPGDHTANFNLVARVPKVEGMPALVGWFIPSGKSIKIPGPKKVPLGAVTAGKAYELAPPTEGFDKMFENGQISFVREKSK